jgi:general secretion pathway protein K
MAKHDERGVALLLALLVLTLLLALILEFDADARREYREAAAFRDQFKAMTLTRAGVEATRAVLLQDARIDKLAGQSFDALTDLWGTPITNYPIGDGLLTAQIEDERGKVNLNELANLSDPNTRTQKITRFKRFFELVQVNSDLVDVIVDWVDADEVPEPTGAESIYYQSLRPAYRAGNAPLQTVSELYLIKGMTDQIVQRLLKYVTVYPAEADGKINLNTADPIVIQALDPRITPSMASEIVQGRPYKIPLDLDRVSSFEPIAKELRVKGGYDVKSSYYSVRIAITVNEVTKSSFAVLRRDESKGDSAVIYLRTL